MEYAQFIDVDPEHSINDNYSRYVGYQDTNALLQAKYYNINTINTISKKLTELLQGVDELNRPIIVPNKTIANIMDSVYQSYRPQTGDIYGRYNIPTGLNSDDYIQSMIDQTIEIIYSEVKNNLEIEQNNKKLSVWTTVLGDFNENKLRSFAPIKVLNKHPQYMAFFENY
jgi:hypothetical protein